MSPIRDRIKDFRRVPASQLREHPHQWRTHSDTQRAALQGVLAEIGFATAVLAYEDADGALVLCDGHLRRAAMGDQPVPVLVLDVTPAEAEILLATLDPLAALAGQNHARLRELVGRSLPENPAVAALLAELVENAARGPTQEAPPADPAAGSVRTQYECPECGHCWTTA